MRFPFRYVTLTLALSAPFVALSCMAPPEELPPPTDAAVKTDQSSIINGQNDNNGHPAVVAILTPQGASCTGTIIQLKGGVGYVLTAAHCCVPGDLPNKVVMGSNYFTGQQFNVLNNSIKTDSCYADCPGSTDDVCMLKFNAPASATFIPPMTPQNDNLAVGTSITYVGYGVTENGNNSVRKFVTKTIGSLDNYFIEYANPQASGTCSGDSGGPGLVNVGGTDFVAGVTSFGDLNCTQLGASIRTRSVYTNFIAPYLADQPPTNAACPVDTDCNFCISDSLNQNCSGGCISAYTACDNDPECKALSNCYDGCSTLACQGDCNTAHVGGIQKYERILECICGNACDAACGVDSLCTANRCGTKPSMATPECKACSESKCCEASWNCSDSSACKKCFTSAAGPECATNPEASRTTSASRRTAGAPAP
ncbi:MAG: trypsin-like serine protease [Polyangiaceae bacterium]